MKPPLNCTRMSLRRFCLRSNINVVRNRMLWKAIRIFLHLPHDLCFLLDH